MTDQNGLVDRLVVDQRTAARLIGVSVSSLRRWARDGTGPQPIRISRLVRYRVTDLEGFVQSYADTRPEVRHPRVSVTGGSDPLKR